MKSRSILVILFILPLSILFSACKTNDAMFSQYIDLDHNSQRLLDFTGIIMTESREYPETAEEVKGVILPKIIISKKLIWCYLDRYYITHYIRNQLNTWVDFSDALPAIDYNHYTYAFHYFPNYDEYIQRNAELICDVLYHFISSRYYGFYNVWRSLSFHLLHDERLGIHLDKLKHELEKEGLPISTYEGAY